MGVPTSEVGYTSAMPRREDDEVHKDMWGHWIKTFSESKNQISINHAIGRNELYSVLSTKIYFKIVVTLRCDQTACSLILQEKKQLTSKNTRENKKSKFKIHLTTLIEVTVRKLYISLFYTVPLQHNAFVISFN